MPRKIFNQGHSPHLPCPVAASPLQMIKAADGGNDPLLYLALDFIVFDDLQVVILAGFFDSCEHGVSCN